MYVIKRGGYSKIQTAANQIFKWCEDNNMKINTDKTKELVIDFSRNPCSIDPIAGMNKKEVNTTSKSIK